MLRNELEQSSQQIDKLGGKAKRYRANQNFERGKKQQLVEDKRKLKERVRALGPPIRNRCRL